MASPGSDKKYREDGRDVRYEDGKRLVRHKSLLGGPGWGHLRKEPHPVRGNSPPPAGNTLKT